MPFTLFRVIFFIIFLFFTSIEAKSYNGQEENQAVIRIKTVVIDAGHGGKDPGALSPDKKEKEKTITLDVALLLGSKIKAAYPDINVIYTRSKDRYLTLAQRSDIANKNHADLFISIHVNSVKGKTSPSGSETHIMGMSKSDANMEVSKIENSVVLLEEDYSTTYQGFDPDNPESFIFFNLMQNAYFEQSLNLAAYIQKSLAKGPIKKNRGIKQTPLLVLWRTTMPSVLVELGFISNKADRQVLTTKAKREEIAKRLFDAFVQYKKQYEVEPQLQPQIEKQSQPQIEKQQEKKPQPQVEKQQEKQPQPEKKHVEKQTQPQSEKQQEKKPQKQEVKKHSTIFKIQIFATKKRVADNSPEFKGEKGYQCTYINGLYKYTIGDFSTKEEAQQALKKYKTKFPGAFVVSVDK